MASKLTEESIVRALSKYLKKDQGRYFLGSKDLDRARDILSKRENIHLELRDSPAGNKLLAIGRLTTRKIIPVVVIIVKNDD